MILDRSTFLPLSIFEISSASLMYPILINSGNIVAKFILVYDKSSVVAVIDNKLEITSCLAYWSTSDIIIKNRILNYKAHNDSNAYFLMIQEYNSNYTDKYASTIIEKTNLNLSHDSWSYTSLDEPGKIHNFNF